MVKKITLLIVCLAVLIISTIGCAQQCSVVGDWYQEEGLGAIEFKKDGDCMVYITDVPLEASYTFDDKTSKGTITIDFLGDITEEEFTYKDETIVYQGLTYTTEYVELIDFGDALDSAIDELDIMD